MIRLLVRDRADLPRIETENRWERSRCITFGARYAPASPSSYIILGLVYTAIMLVTMPGEWTYYIFLGVIEVILTILIVWFAWKWPRLNATQARTESNACPK